MRKRERLEVIHDILGIIRDNGNSIKPTRLIRRSNLSTKGFSGYLEELMKRGLIREDIDKNGSKFYSLTDAGYSYLDKYKTILSFLDEFDL
jgi:predicted transcriptional regulator